MKSTHFARNWHSWSMARWLVLLVFLPIVAASLWAVWLVAHEFRSQREYVQAIAPIRAAGYPLGDAWSEHTFRVKTHREGTALWSQILMLSASLDTQLAVQRPYLGDSEWLPDLDPIQVWPENESVGEFLNEARPMFDLIRLASSAPTPVWQPMLFCGEGTLLIEVYQARTVMDLLQLDFEHAIYNEDPPRALAALQSMQTTTDAFHWNMSLFDVLSNHAFRLTFYQSIQRSLAAQRWNEEQLKTIMDLLQNPLPLSLQWQASWRAQQAFMVSVLENSTVPGPDLLAFRFPTAKLQLMRTYEDLANLADESSADLVRQATEYEAELTEKLQEMQNLDMRLVGQFLPAIGAYARSFAKVETAHRLTLTAVAIKRFQLAHQRWPDELSELTELGLTASVWTIPEAGSFSYAVQDGTATLLGIANESMVPSVIPYFSFDSVEADTGKKDATTARVTIK